MKGGEDAINELKESLKEIQEDKGRKPPKVHKVGGTVRVKIPKGVLDKYPDENWSGCLHKISKSIPAEKKSSNDIKRTRKRSRSFFCAPGLRSNKWP